MSSEPRVEYWVTRVLLHEGRKVQLHLLPPGIGDAVQAEVDVGGFALLTDGSICEPVEVFGNESDAQLHRGKLALRYPNEDFRVLMTADVSV